MENASSITGDVISNSRLPFSTFYVATRRCMRQFTGQNENRAERSRKKEKRIPFPILYAQTLEIEQKESSENRFFLFLSPSNLPEKLIFLFFTTLKKKSLKFLPLKTVLSCLGIFLFFPSSSFSRERETTKLFGKIFISFFFFYVLENLEELY